MIARSTSGCAAELDRLGAVAGLGDHLEIGFRVEHHPQAASDDRVIVDQQDARLERGHERARAPSALRVSTTLQPPSAFVPTCSLAPINAARSRIPRIPAPACSVVREARSVV